MKKKKKTHKVCNRMINEFPEPPFVQSIQTSKQSWVKRIQDAMQCDVIWSKKHSWRKRELVKDEIRRRTKQILSCLYFLGTTLKHSTFCCVVKDEKKNMKEHKLIRLHSPQIKCFHHRINNVLHSHVFMYYF